MKTILKSFAVIFFTAFVVVSCQALVEPETSTFTPHASAKMPALDHDVLGSVTNLQK